MMIIGCDYHPGFQQIAFVDMDSEVKERIARIRSSFYRQPEVRGGKKCGWVGKRNPSTRANGTLPRVMQSCARK
jgi:hypothetical protein